MPPHSLILFLSPPSANLSSPLYAWVFLLSLTKAPSMHTNTLADSVLLLKKMIDCGVNNFNVNILFTLVLKIQDGTFSVFLEIKKDDVQLGISRYQRHKKIDIFALSFWNESFN